MTHSHFGRSRGAPITSLSLLLALAVAGLAGCDEPPPTSPDGPASAGARAELAAADADGVAATRLPQSFFVDPVKGNDANPGTKPLPFKTLAHALSLAIARDTVRLGPLAYSAATNGEKFTNASQQVVVPSGVLILGTPAEDFTSQLVGGPGEIGLNLEGGATVRDVILRGFGTGIRAKAGVQSLKKVILDGNAVGLELSGSAQTTLVGSSVLLTPVSGGSVTGANMSGKAQLTIDGGTMTPGGPNCARDNVTGVEIHNAGRLTLKNGATLKNIAGNALLLFDGSKALLTSSASIDRDFSALPGSCFPAATAFAFDSASLTLRHASIVSRGGTESIGIFSLSRAPLTLDTASVVGHTGAGIFAQLNFKLVANGSLFQGSGNGGVGIDAIQADKSSITITGSNVRSNDIGIRAPSLKLRNSTVTSNRIGILLLGPSANLGQPTATDPGNNTIQNNQNTGVTFDSSVVSGSISASGNTWNTNTQGSDGSGHYPKKPLFDGLSPNASGTNFQLPKSSKFKIQL